jgi:predicted nucleic acid-binding protein
MATYVLEKNVLVDYARNISRII